MRGEFLGGALSLWSLDLGQNEIDTEGRRVLCEGLWMRCTLQSLSLCRDANIGAAGRPAKATLSGQWKCDRSYGKTRLELAFMERTKCDWGSTPVEQDVAEPDGIRRDL